ncbi:integrase, catalytic region, zinc finger, CCHC-type containing protein [Tanacetum coccineum]
MNRDSHVKNSVLANSKNSTKKVAVYVRKNNQTDNTSANVISNKQNVNDVNVANAAKAKNLLCVSCIQNLLIPCHEKCLAKYKLNVHSNVHRALSTNSRTLKFSDTTYVVLKTRFSEKLTQSKSLDTTYVVSKPKIDVAKHMTGDRSLLRNFIEKFMGTVNFRNDNFAAITGYGDCIKGNITICHVYYVEGLGHNLFSVGKFCDGDLEVAFRSKTCYVRNLEGDDLLTGGRESNLYTISISGMVASFPVCLMSKATSTKSWLWHRRLSHLNFGTVNDLTRLDLVDGPDLTWLIVFQSSNMERITFVLLVKEEKARKLLIQKGIFNANTLKDELRKLKGNDLADNVVTKHTIAPEMLTINVEPIAPRLLNNRTAHSEYLRHTQEQAAILREIRNVEPDTFYTNQGSIDSIHHEAISSSLKRMPEDSRNLKSFQRSNTFTLQLGSGRLHVPQPRQCTMWNDEPLQSVVLTIFVNKFRFVISAKTSSHSGVGESRSVAGEIVLPSSQFLAAQTVIHQPHRHKKKPHKPKSEDTNQEKLYLLHMDLCGPMRVASVNGKKYIIVIADDYSLFTWVKCLRSKDEALDFIIKFLKMIQVRLKIHVWRIRTDNGTEFVNQTLREYYEKVGISHEISVAHSLQ